MDFDPRHAHFSRLVGSLVFLERKEDLVNRSIEATRIFLDAQGALLRMPASGLVLRLRRRPGYGTALSLARCGEEDYLPYDAKWENGLMRVSLALENALSDMTDIEVGVRGFSGGIGSIPQGDGPHLIASGT